MTYRDCSADILIDQIGMMNIFAVSGGRVQKRQTGVTLPVGYGYSVEIDLDFNDLYVVKRVYTKAGKRTVKGEVTDVFAFNVGEIAYQASCFVNVDFGDHKVRA